MDIEAFCPIESLRAAKSQRPILTPPEQSANLGSVTSPHREERRQNNVTQNGELKKAVAAGVLLLGAGAYSLMAKAQDYQPCNGYGQAYADGFCTGSGEGAPAYNCESDSQTLTIAFDCQDGTFNIVAFC